MEKMFPSTITMQWHKQTLLVILLISLAYAQDRKITSKLNPGCTKCTSNNTTLMYIRAVGSEDTIHQIWDFTGGIPSMIFVIAGTNSSMDITWVESDPFVFTLTEKPKYSFAAVIDELYEYNDLDDIGKFNPNTPQKAYSLRHLAWNRTNLVSNDNEVMVELETHLFKDHHEWRKGNIGIKLDLLPFKAYAVELPHLIHTANSTLVDLSLVNITTNHEYNASRFAWHFTLVSTDPAMDTMHSAMRKSLDDEHTPGVFEIMEIKTPESYWREDGGFMQFRPVAYTTRDRGVTSSIIAHLSSMNRTRLPGSSTVERFYDVFDPKNLLVQDVFISFGEAGDGFYKKHNYTAWSFTVGYGAPPIEGFSLFVVLVISIGLGVPVVLALSGVAYVVSRRCKQRNAPRRFTDAD